MRLVRGDTHEMHFFEHGAKLPGEVVALKVGVRCPEEMAFYFKLHGGIISVADAVIRVGKRMVYVKLAELFPDQETPSSIILNILIKDFNLSAGLNPAGGVL